jgi:hypothetical protein
MSSSWKAKCFLSTSDKKKSNLNSIQLKNSKSRQRCRLLIQWIQREWNLIIFEECLHTKNMPLLPKAQNPFPFRRFVLLKKRKASSSFPFVYIQLNHDDTLTYRLILFQDKPNRLDRCSFRIKKSSSVVYSCTSSDGSRKRILLYFSFQVHLLKYNMHPFIVNRLMKN